MITVLAGMVHKDLRLFFSDRRAVLMSFAVPIAIASFFGSIFSGGGTNEPARISVAIVDRDRSAVSTAIVAAVASDRNFAVTPIASDTLREAVRQGKTTIGITIPEGFGAAAARAFFGPGEKPSLDLMYDPSHRMELAMVRGILTQHVMTAVSREVFTGSGGRAMVDETLSSLNRSGLPATQQALLRDLLTSAQRYYTEAAPSGAAGNGAAIAMPYSTHEEAITSGSNVQYNGYAHSFAGMGIQFLLFAAANLGVEVLLERQRGLWRRIRSAPVSRQLLLAGKMISGTIIALLTLLVSFGFAMVVFHVRIHGSLAGFLGVAVAAALMAATFGLLVAALGRTPGATRGVTTLAVLMMVMLGGAWVPTFVFPQWLQRATVVVPARWAVDGLDAMTWRGLNFSAALVPIAVLLGFAALFWTIAATRFRWEE